jgi:peptidyl-tRNA hydrolase
MDPKIDSKIDERIVMYIFVNTDLKMSAGKIASQVGHVVQLITEEIIRKGYEINPTPKCYFDYVKWKKIFGCAKIILKANTLQLKELIERDNSRFIIDEGRTQVDPNSLTVVGFYPSSTNDMNKITKEYKLL